jgi:hypothetical protein
MLGAVGKAMRCYRYREGTNDANDDQQADIRSPPSANLNATALQGSYAFEDDKQAEREEKNELM